MDAMTILVVAPTPHADDSAWTIDWSELAPGATIEHVPDPAAVVRRLSAGCSVDLIVTIEPRPGVVTQADVDAVQRAAPLTRVWRLLGGWCEGEQRSGHPPVGSLSAYWHQALARLSREIVAARAGRCAAWSLPVTISPEERTLAVVAAPLEQHTGVVVVRAERAETAAALADACRLGGYEVVVGNPGDDVGQREPIAIVWDTTVDQMIDAAAVRNVRQGAAGAPLVAVVGFPREEDAPRARSVGVAAVVSKPYVVSDLLWHVARCAPGSAKTLPA